jgi:Resolvase, N terminal domain
MAARFVMNKRAGIYVRVSTDKQTVENQLRELRWIAERRGWEVVQEYHDARLSGAKSREATCHCARSYPLAGKAETTNLSRHFCL